MKEEQVSDGAAGAKKEAGAPDQAALVKRKWYQRMKPSPDGGAPGQEAKPYGCLIKLCLLLAAFAGILLVIWALVQMSVNDISTDAVSRGMCSYVFCKEDASTSYFAIGDGEIPPNPNYSASSHTYDRTNTDTWLEREKHTYLVPTEDGSYEVKTEKNWVEHEDTRITGTATYTNIAGLYCDLHKESGYHLIRGALNHRPYIQLAAGVALIAVCIAFGKRNMKKSRRYAVTAAAVAVVVLAAVVPSAALQTAHAEKLSYQYAGKLAAAGDYGEARAVYAALGDYKDSPEKLASVDQQIALARQEEAYNAAVALLDEEKYHEALAAFTKLGDFKDSAEQLSGVQEALYSEAVALAQAGEYDEAITTFTELGDYKDSADKLNEVYKQKAESLLADGKDTEAQELFTKIGYEDDYVKSIRYPEAEALLADGDKVHAAMAFGALGDYKDARSRSFALWDEIADRKTIATGGGQTVGLRSDGTVVAAGSNKYGQCNVSGWTDIVAVSTDGNSTVGLRADGTVVATGDNQYGQINASDWTDIVAIAAGWYHTVGLRSDGTVVAVGQGQNDGDTWVVDGLTDIVAVSTNNKATVGLRSDGTVVTLEGVLSGWTDIVAVAAGSTHTVGLRSDGTVVAVGNNYMDKCNVGDWTDIVAVAADGNTIGLRSDGTVVAVGYDKDGQNNVSGWTDIKLPNR